MRTVPEILEQLNKTLTIPAAEYVPAIGDAFLLIDEALAAHRAQADKQGEAEPLFWYRPCRDGLYEGPVHHKSVGGTMLRAEKPGEWFPLYASPHQVAQQEQAPGWQDIFAAEPPIYDRVFVVALDADDDPYVTTAHFNGWDKRGPIFLGAGKVRHESKYWHEMLELPAGIKLAAPTKEQT